MMTHRRSLCMATLCLAAVLLVMTGAPAHAVEPTPTVTVTETATVAASPAVVQIDPSQFAVITDASESVAFVEEYGRNVVGVALCLVVFFLAFLAVRSFSR